MPWYAGNLHCHSTNSDGDASPLEVANWYREHGYSFLSITDHNRLTPPEEYDLNEEDFIGIPGSEFTRGKGDRQTHVNGIGIQEKIPLPESDLNLVETLQFGIDRISELGGLSMINHPNWLWSFGAHEMAQTKGATLFEVFNGGFTCNNDGDAGHDSTDQIWDKLLSVGQRIYGIATDDAHAYGDMAICPKGFKDSPGTGWIWVDAPELKANSILDAIRVGDFIATNGIKFSSLIRNQKEYSFEIEPMGKVEFTTYFIGSGGQILSEQYGQSPCYKIRGDEGYIRARVECTDRIKAWAQPIFL